MEKEAHNRLGVLLMVPPAVIKFEKNAGSSAMPTDTSTQETAHPCTTASFFFKPHCVYKQIACEVVRSAEQPKA